MNISYNWLKDYVNFDLSPEELSAALTSIGLETGGIEEVQTIKGGLNGLVIGKVLTCEDHPNSDHLHITTVDLGESEPVQIVCGAANVAAGQYVVVATLGTVLYSGEESFTIKKSKIRGVESFGMICAEDEIGIGHDHAGIIVLPSDARVGMPAAEYYHITTDYTIEIDITPNRVDGASHLGVARDLAAYLQQTQEIHYTLPSVAHFAADSNTAGISIEVQRPEACPRYAGVCIEGVKVQESPEWLQTRLKAIGLHPINNVVDITNFILFELGQPLHSFDKDKIKGNKVIVRSFPTGTRFTTLDGVERELNENDLMVCNTEEPMCIAGVFGGLESGITEATTNVFLESACFDPVFVRKTARRHGLNTDASFRFERGTDPNIVIYALKRADQRTGWRKDYVRNHRHLPESGSRFRSRSKVCPHRSSNRQKNRTRYDQKNPECSGNKDCKRRYRRAFVADPPLSGGCSPRSRRDRGYFKNIEVPAKVNSTLSYSEKPDDFQLKNKIADLLAANGFNEIMNNSLTKASYYEHLETYRPEETVMLFNPLSSDLSAMRQSLLFGGLETIAYNINRKNSNLRLFEFGKAYTFHKKEGENHLKQYKEEDKLALFITGDKIQASWNSKEQKTDFFNLKSYAEMILIRLGFKTEMLTLEECSADIYREGISYTQNGKHIVTIGMLSHKVLKSNDIEQEVYYAEFSWENILKAIKNHTITFTPMPKFPAVKRDLALLLDKKISFKEVRDIAFRTEKSLLKSVTLFDVYEGEKLGAGKKSYAISFTLQDDEKTLTDKQIDKIMNKLMGTYKHQLGAEIR
mgnify:CR=1 FL=1